MSFSKIYDFTLTAGGSQRILVQGDYVRVMSSTGAVEIVTDLIRIGPIVAGQGQKNTPFQWVTINDKSSAGNVGTILIADSDFVDQTILGAVSVNGTVNISGSVSTIDGEKARTLAGGMYAGAAAIGAVAAQYANCQLWNPVGSGKNLIVVQADAGSPTASNPVYLGTTIQCATLYAYPGGNKKIAGGVANVAQLRVENRVASDPYTFGILKNIFVGASMTSTWLMKGAIVVPPGCGFNCSQATANAQLNCNFEWFEE